MYRIILWYVLILSHSSSMINNVTKRFTGSVFRNGFLAQEGETVELSCPVHRPWFFCVWTSPLEERQCAINSKQGSVSQACANPRIQISGNHTICSIKFQAKSKDHGAWACIITYDEDFRSQKMFVDLQVAMLPTIQIKQIREGDNARGSNIMLNKTKTNATGLYDDENNATSLFDNLDQEIDDDFQDLIVGDLGEKVRVECIAFNAFPRPEISVDISSSETWSGFKDCKDQIGMTDKNHLFNISKISSFYLTEEKNNSKISCTVRQVDKFTGEVLFHERISSTIFVFDPPVSPLTRKQESAIGPIIVALFMLLGLLTSFCLIPLCIRKRRRRSEARNRQILDDNLSIQKSIQDDLLYPIVEINPFKEELLKTRYKDSSRENMSIKARLLESLVSVASTSEDEEEKEKTVSVYQKHQILQNSVSTLNSVKTIYSGSFDDETIDLTMRARTRSLDIDATLSVKRQLSPAEVEFHASSKSQDNFVKSEKEILMNRNDYLTLTEKQAEILNHLLKENKNERVRSNAEECANTNNQEVNEVCRRKKGLEPMESKDGRCRKRKSVFYCNEGCFRSETPCQHSQDCLALPLVVNIEKTQDECDFHYLDDDIDIDSRDLDADSHSNIIRVVPDHLTGSTYSFNEPLITQDIDDPPTECEDQPSLTEMFGSMLQIDKAAGISMC